MQSSLHYSRQTNLPSSNAKSFAMKKTLAQQVRDYLTFMGPDFTPAKLASEVARHQRDLPESKRCKRQNIEQLLDCDFKTVRYIQPLAMAMGTTVEALSAGAYLPGAPAAHGNVSPAPIGARSVPLISAIQAGMWSEIVDNFQPGDADEWLLTDLELSAGSFALTIRGDSMLPEFNPGDRVIIDPAIEPHPGDFVAAKNGEQEATFKKYRPRGMDANGKMVFELVPLNDDYPTLRSDIDQIRIVGTMVEHRKYRRPR